MLAIQKNCYEEFTLKLGAISTLNCPLPEYSSIYIIFCSNFSSSNFAPKILYLSTIFGSGKYISGI